MTHELIADVVQTFDPEAMVHSVLCPTTCTFDYFLARKCKSKTVSSRFNKCLTIFEYKRIINMQLTFYRIQQRLIYEGVRACAISNLNVSQRKQNNV